LHLAPPLATLPAPARHCPRLARASTTPQSACNRRCQALSATALHILTKAQQQRAASCALLRLLKAQVSQLPHPAVLALGPLAPQVQKSSQARDTQARRSGSALKQLGPAAPSQHCARLCEAPGRTSHCSRPAMRAEGAAPQRQAASAPAAPQAALSPSTVRAQRRHGPP